MKKRLSNFFQLLSKDIGLLIFAIILCPLCIAFFIQMYNSVGAFEPPTEEDYKWLHEQEEKVKEKFDNVYLIEGASIKMRASEIKVILISKEDKNYELHMTFDENKKFITSEEICNKEGFTEDSCLGKYDPIMKAIILGIALGVLSAMALQVGYCLIYNEITKK